MSLEVTSVWKTNCSKLPERSPEKARMLSCLTRASRPRGLKNAPSQYAGIFSRPCTQTEQHNDHCSCTKIFFLHEIINVGADCSRTVYSTILWRQASGRSKIKLLKLHPHVPLPGHPIQWNGHFQVMKTSIVPPPTLSLSHAHIYTHTQRPTSERMHSKW